LLTRKTSCCCVRDETEADITKLTVKSVNAAKPQSKDVVVWDNELPGFGLRIKPSGIKSFILQYRNSHRQSRRMTIGRYGVLAPEEARRIAKRHLGTVADGKDPVAARKAVQEAPTVADLAGRYIEEHAKPKKKASSVRMDRINLRIHVLPAIGKKKLAAVTRGDIAKVHSDMRRTPGAANRVLSLIGKMMNLAEKWDLRPDGSNPCRHVEKFPERMLERFLSEDELNRLGAVLSEAEVAGRETPSTVAAVRLLIFTGARTGEILNLRWEDMNFEHGLILIGEHKTSGNATTAAKAIPLNAPALGVLQGIERRDGCDWVIPGRKGNKPLVNLRKPWGRIRKAAGMEDVRLHDLRHSFASFGAGGGLSLHMIGALLGHSQPGTTARYAHLAVDPVKQASEMIGSRILAAMNSENPKTHAGNVINIAEGAKPVVG
jgi:integrase